MDPILEKIALEAAQTGAISFARFMELALYCPVYGFYEREEDTIGQAGSFYTSVTVGPFFGQLLAARFAQWLEDLGPRQVPGSARSGSVQIVEAGAHDGALANDILLWIQQHAPEVFARTEYWIVEPSARRRSRQQHRLADFRRAVYWANDLRTAARGELRGIVFANELLDAMPVRRFAWDAALGEWFEWGVTVEAERVVWKRMDSSRPTGLGDPKSSNFGPGSREAAPVPQFPAEMLRALPDGYVIEVSPAAQVWWRQAAQALRCGRLLTFDYGFCQEDIWVPGRRDGTLRAYQAHRLCPDVLANPGRQDITAHVDFTAIQAAGEAEGLCTEIFQSQGQFLTGIAANIWAGQLPFGPWSTERTRQFQTLTHPEHLGRAFRVLVQKRDPPGGHHHPGELSS